MSHGGKRPGSGRRKGSTNKATEKRREVAQKALEQGTTPLEIILEAMRVAYESGGPIAAVPFAKEAAPYVHPKLANIEAKTQTVANIVIEGPLAKT